MFKSTTLLLFLLALLPVLQPTRSMAQTAEPNRSNNNVTQQSDPIDPPTEQRTPESIERERERTRIRQQTALEEQLEWRRRYGDLAPSRQRSER
jgi:hypothetical protein